MRRTKLTQTPTAARMDGNHEAPRRRPGTSTRTRALAGPVESWA